MKNIFIIFLLFFVFSSCKSDYDKIELKRKIVEPDQAIILKGLGDIENQLALDWLNQTIALQQSAKIFIDKPDLNNLQTLQLSWKAARDPWESNESFAFGPVSDFGIDAATDTWPFDKGAFIGILNSNVVLNSAYIIQMSNSTKGFHAIEYLIFGEIGSKKENDFTGRELIMLGLLTDDLKKQSGILYQSWTPGTQKSFYDNFINAGKAGSQYTSAEDALIEVISAMVNIMIELPEKKIETPLAKQNADYAESKFADYSLNDYKNNILGVQSVYLGKYKNMVADKSISAVIEEKNPALNMKVITQFKLCIALMDVIYPTTFNIAIKSNTEQLKEIQLQLRLLNKMLDSEVKPALVNL